MITRVPFSLLLFILALGCQTATDVPDKEAIPPEIATGRKDVRPPAEAERFMVAAAHPIATEAGLEMLKKGGSAVDAAIAVQMALTVVEPQSSGIGGGAFMLFHDAGASVLRAYDGRETAPAAVTDRLFLDDEGAPLDFFRAVVGGRSVGAPGALRMLEMAHKAHGKLPWADLFVPAIRAAEEGFPLGERLHKQLANDWVKEPAFKDNKDARGLYYDESGVALAPGTLIKNPMLAQVFKDIAAGGADEFYKGALADDIVKAVTSAENPGLLTKADLEAYEPKAREAVCRSYRAHKVCGFPPPTSGGVTVLQILGMLERFDVGSLSPTSPEFFHLLVEAERLAYADRNLYLADADFVNVPISGLLDDDYLKSRAALIDPARATEAEPGTPPGATARARDRSPELPSTSHMVIVDEARNVVSMTTSIEFVFGSRVFVRGFLLNNQLTDFSFVPEENGKKIANRVQPKKRPRSSMAPLIIYKNEKPRFGVGSPGGSRIIPYVAQTAIALIDHRLDPQRAVSLPHVLSRGGPVEVEASAFEPKALEGLEAALTARGHTLKRGEQTSGLQVIALDDARLYGGADPRRDGLAKGE